ncbi:Multidrug resistance protein MdtK [Botrimarina colliarenosi]|uniref:Multidrug-efflux transporter n=2 Tax=Botrimarina colliarenosi TaxID=2528001 RepID=A0A5C6AL96_9BACT|nr:Multidrug resistance protein MdtK [Botrimarina colliarenosi]
MRLSLPVLAEQVLHLLVGLSDLALTGRLLEGTEYVAGMTLVIYLLWLVGTLFAFIATGATPLTARFTGAGQPEMANRVMNQSITVGLAWTVVLMLVGLPIAAPAVAMMGLEGPSAEAAARYLTIELCVLPAIMFERVGIACLRGAGDTMSGLWVMALVNVVNIGVSYTLVTGAGGAFTPLGWDGVALGTAAGHLVGAALLVAMLAGGRAGYRMRPSLMKPDPAMIRRLLRIGIPGGAEAVLLVVCNLAYLRIVLKLGDVAAAAHGVAIQVESLAFLPGGAFQIAASTTTGQYLGAGDPARATRSAWAATAVASAFMVAAGVVFWFTAEDLIGLFVFEKPDVVSLAAQLLRLISLAMLPLAVSMVLAGALRGAGDTRWPLLFTIIGFGLVRVPLAMYLSQETVTLPLIGATFAGAGWGAVGAWCGAVTDLCVRATLMTGRFVNGGWKTVEV